MGTVEDVAKEITRHIMADLTPLLNHIKELNGRIKELEEGDYWMQKAKEYLENGNCPVCFATDEEGHRYECLWGKAERKIKELEEVDLIRKTQMRKEKKP